MPLNAIGLFPALLITIGSLGSCLSAAAVCFLALAPNRD
jgi:hypothetical protein